MDRLHSSFISSFVVVRGYVCALPSSVLVAPRTAFFILSRIAAENTAQGIKGIAFGDDDIFISWVERVQTYCAVLSIYNKLLDIGVSVQGEYANLPVVEDRRRLDECRASVLNFGIIESPEIGTP